MKNRYLRILGLGADEKLDDELKARQLARLRKGEVSPEYKPVNQNYEEVNDKYQREYPPRP